MPLGDYLPKQEGSALSKYINKPNPPGVLKSFLPAAGRGLVSGFAGFPALVAGGLGKLGESMIPGRARGPITPQSLVDFGLGTLEKEGEAQEQLSEAIRATPAGRPVSIPEYALSGLPPEVLADPGAEDPMERARGPEREMRSPAEGLLRGTAYAPDMALGLGMGAARRGAGAVAKYLAKGTGREAAEGVAARGGREALETLAEKNDRIARSILDLETEGPAAREAMRAPGSFPGAAEVAAARLEADAAQRGKSAASLLSPESAEAVDPIVREHLKDRVAQRAIDEMESLRPVGRETVSSLEGRHRANPFTRLARDWSARPGVLTEYLGKEIDDLTFEAISVQGRNRHLGMRDAHNQYLADAVTEASGFPVRGFRGRKAERWLREHIDLPTETQGTMQITRDEAAHLLAMAKDPDNRRVILRDGLHIERLDPEEPVRISEEALRTLERTLGASGEGRLAQAAFERMPAVSDEINQATRRVLGEEIATRPQYFPRRRVGREIETGLNTFQELREQVLDSMGLLKARTGGRQPVRLGNLTDEFTGHVDDSTRFSAYLEPVNNANEVLKRPDVAERIKAALGTDGFDRIMDAIDVQTIPIRSGRVKGDAKIRALMRSTGAGILGARLGPLFLNPSGLMVSAAYQPGGFRHLAKALASPLRWGDIDKIASRFSPAWRDRYQNNFMHHATSGMLGESKRKFGPKSASEIALAPLEVSDKFGATIRWGAAESRIAEEMPHLARGSDEYYEQVAREWERMMYRGENTSHGFELSGALAQGRKNPWFGSMVMFQSSTSKIYSLLPRAAGQLKKGDIGGATRSLAGFLGAQAYAAWARTAVKYMRGQVEGTMLDPRDERARKEFLKTMLEESAGLPPFFGNSLKAIARTATGKGTFSFPTGTIEGMLQQGVQAGQGFALAAQDYLEDEYNREGEPAYRDKLAKALRKTASLGATAKGVPFEGLTRDLPALVRRAFGKIRAEDANLAAALVEDDSDRDSAGVTKAGNKLWAAVREEDSALFRQALEQKKRAGGSMKQSALINSIKNRGKFQAAAKYAPKMVAGVETNERRLEASEDVLEAADALLAERDQAVDVFLDLLRENEDLVSGFAGDGQDYLDTIREGASGQTPESPP